jgi:hypothetical protein
MLRGAQVQNIHTKQILTVEKAEAVQADQNTWITVYTLSDGARWAEDQFNKNWVINYSATRP